LLEGEDSLVDLEEIDSVALERERERERER